MLMIKRYKNRKLYNLNGKSYITLLQLGELIRKGEEISVEDVPTNRNITALILSQILTEQIKHSAYVPDSRQSQTPDEQKAELAVKLRGLLRDFTTRILDTTATEQEMVAEASA